MRQYVALALLFAATVYMQSGNMAYLMRVVAHSDQIAADPFSITNGTRTIANGEFRGDQILAINGHPFNAEREFVETVASSRPGDTIRLTLSEPGGRSIERLVVFQSVSPYRTGSSVAVAIVLTFLIPVVALGLGFFVALMRPTDSNAWIVLFLMMSFTELIRDFSPRGPFPDLKLAWAALWNTAWPISLMFFGIYFPTRSDGDKRRPWVKYIFVLLFAVIDLGFWGTILLWRHDINAAAATHISASRLYFLQMLMAVLATAGFFANFRVKSAAERSADARRRLSILRVGSWISLGPIVLLALYAVASGTTLFAQTPPTVNIAALLLMTFFPLTLGYVLVVERAMDLRFVVRMGIKYGLARVGLWAVRAALVAGAIYIFAAAFDSRNGMGWRQPAELSAIGAGLLILRKRGADSVSGWLDRKFFRESYNAEKVLADLASEVGRYLEIGPLLERVAVRIGETLHIADVVILLRDGNTFKTAYSTRHGEPMDLPVSSRIVANLDKRREPLDVQFDKPPAWLRSLSVEELQTLDFMRTQLLLPVAGRDYLAGIISLGPKLSEAPYSDTDMRLLQAVAWQTGMALENSRLLASLAEEAAQRERINTELEIAREVQERLFPQNYPAVAGIEYAGYCRPAQGVGGDYYDFLQLPDGKAGIAIGDVSGKGIAAALLMASLQASLRGQAMTGRGNLARLMENVNRLVFEASTASRYATFFYAEFDPATRKLCYVNAGHNAPMVLRGEQVIRLDVGGPVVGLLPGASYEQGVCQLQSGDVFIAYTDGISEAMTTKEEEWGDDRLIAAAKESVALAPSDMIRAIFIAADRFTGSAKQYDDMTLVVMKLN